MVFPVVVYGCESWTIKKIGGGLVADPYLTLVIPWTVAHQAPLSMRFSWQEYWSGLPFPSSADLSHSGIEPGSPALQADSLLSEPLGKPKKQLKLATKSIKCC